MSDVFTVPMETITEDLKLGDLTEWDSLGHLNLFMEIESTFGVSFSADQMVETTSVQAILHLLATVNA
ncbi:hypothetical protein AN477_17410 [Alicyclobacillus ferrooxydans]|uniref:Carrier domain-containing protein n=2 Tax=Alicyclobacillus ferrooxydans TaxID=471514 RepID=A0A0P9EI91_9BACL|nr:hypothetical protein AN477_17410 [Alicyclobacillus ferrooxydans]